MANAMGAYTAVAARSMSCTLIVTCVPVSYRVSQHGRSTVQRAPGNHPLPSETNRQKLMVHYERIYLVLPALYSLQRAYLDRQPFWYLTSFIDVKPSLL